MQDKSPQTIYLKDYTVPEYVIKSVELTFILDELKTRVISKMTILKNPDSKVENAALVLLGEGLELVSVAMEGLALNGFQYKQSSESLTIENVPQEQFFVLSIENIINPKANTALEGLYLSSTMLCTQCEAEGFRKITYFLDRPDVMTVFKTTLIGDKDKYPVLLSNGNKVAEGELKNNQHWVTWKIRLKSRVIYSRWWLGS
jgi:aminopeptidase N